VTVLGLSDNFNTGYVLDQTTETRSDQGMIIGNENA
jgi:hypothetical protein